MKIDKDSPQVRFPPPLILLAFILTGIALQALHPIHFVPEPLRWLLSLPLMGAAIATVLHCASAFRKAHTEIKPWKTTSQLIGLGVYRFSRNPIYLSFITFDVGVAIAADNLWIALLALPLGATLGRFVIQKEEAYLEKKFGQTYTDYRKQVRRWL